MLVSCRVPECEWGECRVVQSKEKAEHLGLPCWLLCRPFPPAGLQLQLRSLSRPRALSSAPRLAQRNRSRHNFRPAVSSAPVSGVTRARARVPLGSTGSQPDSARGSNWSLESSWSIEHYPPWKGSTSADPSR